MTLSACIHSLHTVGKTTYRSNSTIDNVCYYVVVVVVVVLIINTYHLSKFLLFYSMTKYGIFLGFWYYLFISHYASLDTAVE